MSTADIDVSAEIKDSGALALLPKTARRYSYATLTLEGGHDMFGGESPISQADYDVAGLTPHSVVLRVPRKSTFRVMPREQFTAALGQEPVQGQKVSVEFFCSLNSLRKGLGVPELNGKETSFVLGASNSGKAARMLRDVLLEETSLKSAVDAAFEGYKHKDEEDGGKEYFLETIPESLSDMIGQLCHVTCEDQVQGWRYLVAAKPTNFKLEVDLNEVEWGFSFEAETKQGKARVQCFYQRGMDAYKLVSTVEGVITYEAEGFYFDDWGNQFAQIIDLDNADKPKISVRKK